MTRMNRKMRLTGAGPRSLAHTAGLSALPLLLALVLALSAAVAPAQAAGPFAQVPPPRPAKAVALLAPNIDTDAYRREVGRHLYAAYPSRVFRGVLPPNLFAVLMTEAEIDARGRVLQVSVVRPPASSAAAAVPPWVIGAIERAAPYPVPAGMGAGTLTWREVWLVDRSGRFQVQLLSEGQR
jgi:periplasmic protein TonB